MNENKMLKSQYLHKNKLYEMDILNCFKNKKIKMRISCLFESNKKTDC